MFKQAVGPTLLTSPVSGLIGMANLRKYKVGNLGQSDARRMCFRPGVRSVSWSSPTASLRPRFLWRGLDQGLESVDMDLCMFETCYPLFGGAILKRKTKATTYVAT